MTVDRRKSLRDLGRAHGHPDPVGAAFLNAHATLILDRIADVFDHEPNASQTFTGRQFAAMLRTAAALNPTADQEDQ